MANHYLMKYKGKYRILPELDYETNDFPRDYNGNIAESYSDIYIACRNNNKIYEYGHMKGNSKTVWLVAYIPSIGRGRNIKRELDSQGFEYIDYYENDEEVEFKFKSKDIDTIATLLKAKTSGANISPFSPRNLPTDKKLVQISTEEMQRYKEISAKVKKTDLLLIHKLTNQFLANVLSRKYRKIDSSFNYKKEIKKLKLSRLVKEYIYYKNMWNEYLSYLDKEIDKFYKTNG